MDDSSEDFEINAKLYYNSEGPSFFVYFPLVAPIAPWIR